MPTSSSRPLATRLAMSSQTLTFRIGDSWALDPPPVQMQRSKSSGVHIQYAWPTSAAWELLLLGEKVVRNLCRCSYPSAAFCLHGGRLPSHKTCTRKPYGLNTMCLFSQPPLFCSKFWPTDGAETKIRKLELKLKQLAGKHERFTMRKETAKYLRGRGRIV